MFILTRQTKTEPKLKANCHEINVRLTDVLTASRSIRTESLFFMKQGRLWSALQLGLVDYQVSKGNLTQNSSTEMKNFSNAKRSYHYLFSQRRLTFKLGSFLNSKYMLLKTRNVSPRSLPSNTCVKWHRAVKYIWKR